MPGITNPTIEAWLGSLHRTPNTIRTYRQHIEAFETWITEQDLDVHDVTPDDLARYSLHIHQRNLAHATMGARFNAVRQLYRWLYVGGRVSRDPAINFDKRYGSKQVSGDVLSLADLRTLIARTRTPTQRAVLLLILVNGLGSDEVRALKISDLIVVDGQHYLRMPDKDPVPLPDIVAEAVLAAVGERRRGPLLLNKWGTQMSAPILRNLTARVGEAAKLGVTVSPLLLQASMRTIAIQEPISTVALVQGLGAGAQSNLLERAKIAQPARQHFAFRMALLLRPDGESTSALLDHADGLASHHGLPEAARVMVAGAAFERHLRTLAIKAGAIDPNTERTTIAGLTGILIGRKVIRPTDEKACNGIQTARDWAAHGWFEKITPDVADRAIADARRIAAAYPITD